MPTRAAPKSTVASGADHPDRFAFAFAFSLALAFALALADDDRAHAVFTLLAEAAVGVEHTLGLFTAIAVLRRLGIAPGQSEGCQKDEGQKQKRQAAHTDQRTELCASIS